MTRSPDVKSRARTCAPSASRRRTTLAPHIGMFANSIAQAELVENNPSFGRDRAAAGLVARESAAIGNDDALDAELSQMERGRQPGGTRADDADIGVNHAAAGTVGRLRFDHARPLNCGAIFSTE